MYIMKSLFTICLLLLMQMSFGQKLIQEDSLIRALHATLPPGFEMKMYDELLSIECKDSVWVYWKNHANEGRPEFAYPTEDAQKEIVQTNGRLVDLALSYRLEPKWDDRKRQETLAYNDSIHHENGKLWKKYGLEKFYHRVKHGHGKAFEESRFEPKTKADTLAMEHYMTAHQKLWLLLRPLPDYCTERYSLFNLDDGDFGGVLGGTYAEDVYPMQAYKEYHEIAWHISSKWACKE